MPLSSTYRSRLLVFGWLIAGTLAALWGTTPGYGQNMHATVPVGLFAEDAPQELRIKAERHALRLFAGDDRNPVAVVPPHQQAVIQRRDQDVHVRLDDLAFFALSLRIVPDGDAPVRVVTSAGQAPETSRAYAGTVTILPNPATTSTLQLVNDVPLEDYVAAVVAREYGFDDREGARAMAILARTYALHRLDRTPSATDVALSDDVRSQVYDGADRITPVAREAALATRGEVLTYDGDLAEVAYSSSSGGHTADNDAVWDGTPLPYLRGIPDPYDAASPHRAWDSTIPRDDLLHLLSRTYGFKVGGFYLGDRGRDGRVLNIELLHPNLTTARVIRSNEFRLLVNEHFGSDRLKSTMFDARRDNSRYIFSGSGYGHGVGMSQYGALEMSRQGFTYREILAYYFNGTQVQRYGDTAPAPALANDTPQPPARTTPQPKQAANQTSSKRRVGW